MNEAERARDALHFLDAGCTHDEWVRLGMAAKSAGLDFDDFHNWSASAGNYVDENKCRTAWKSFDNSGAVTPATLFGTAIEQGWKDPTRGRAKAMNRSIPCPTLAKPAPIAPKPAAQSDKALTMWERCIPATLEQPYIARKGGIPDGVRVYPASAEPLIIGKGDEQITAVGGLVVPCWSGNRLQTLQIIPVEGPKKNLPGASFDDGFFTVGEVTDRVYIVEGIGQAWAVNQATGCAAVVCFGAGRMARIAETLRASYSAATLVIVPDRGKEEQAAKIAADVSGLWVAMPDDKPGNYDANDFLMEAGAGALADLLERAQPPVLRYQILNDDDMEKRPPQQWRIKGILPMTGTAAIFGASGSGKSFAVIDMVQAVASGHSWFGYKTKPCKVLYCALEGEGGLAGRLAAYRAQHGATSSNVGYLVQPFSLLESGDIADLAQAIKATGHGAEVVILDTLNRAAPGADENDSRDMGRIIAAAKELQTRIGGLVGLVHHSGKDASKGLRGHSSLHAALDAAIEVRREGDRREWVIAKAKEGEEGKAHSFRLAVVELGNDEDGDLITSCVAVPDNEPGGRTKQKRLTEGQRQGIAAYCIAANEGMGEMDAAGAFAGISLESWRDAFYRISTADNTDAKKKAFQRVRSSLQADGLLLVSHDVYRVTEPSVSVREGAFTKAILDRDTGQSRDIGGTCPDHNRDGTGHVSIDMSRCPDGDVFGKEFAR